jgi:hypothetical protein
MVWQRDAAAAETMADALYPSGRAADRSESMNTKHRPGEYADSGSEDDTEGQIFMQKGIGTDEDDTEGQKFQNRVAGDEDDTEGQKFQRSATPDEDDTEGQKFQAR